MSRRFAATVCGFALLGIAPVGCTTCRHRAEYDALASGGTEAANAGARNDVVTFVLGGPDPFDRGPDRLASGLNASGYAKVYTGTRFHADWFVKEARRVTAENPGTRFAVVGRRGGAARAADLVSRLQQDGIPVAAFVLLDPDWESEPAVPVASALSTVFHSTEESTEAPDVAGVLSRISRRERTGSPVPVILPLVDDPAPTPEVVAIPPAATPVSR